jgi:hypothetical protein
LTSFRIFIITIEGSSTVYTLKKILWKHRRETEPQEHLDVYRRVKEGRFGPEQHSGLKDSCPTCAATGRASEFVDTISFFGVCTATAAVLTLIFFVSALLK